jgi:hypothetical protein
MNAVLRIDAAQFAERLRAPGSSIISPAAYVDCMQMTTQRLAELAKVHRTTLQRSPAAEKVQDYLRESISIIGQLVEVNGGELERAMYWYKNVPLVELGGKTAEQYVADGKVEGVRRYVRSLAAGATG